ncbi:hypothetical protein C8Q79DRAFT_1012855 [Trametes meyenii]|nr:hypothetical protein C8Q79DRAFT_1012855 [Trametes meyenii]
MKTILGEGRQCESPVGSESDAEMTSRLLAVMARRLKKQRNYSLPYESSDDDELDDTLSSDSGEDAVSMGGDSDFEDRDIWMDAPSGVQGFSSHFHPGGGPARVDSACSTREASANLDDDPNNLCPPLVADTSLDTSVPDTEDGQTQESSGHDHPSPHTPEIDTPFTYPTATYAYCRDGSQRLRVNDPLSFGIEDRPWEWEISPESSRAPSPVREEF